MSQVCYCPPKLHDFKGVEESSRDHIIQCKARPDSVASGTRAFSLPQALSFVSAVQERFQVHLKTFVLLLFVALRLQNRIA